MKKLLLLSFSLLSFKSFTQNENVKTNNQSRFKIGIITQSNFSYRRLFMTEKTEINNFTIASRNQIEIPKFGYTLGVNIETKLTDKLFLETGIAYSNKGYRTKKLELFGFGSNSTKSTHIRGVYSHHYIEVPLLFNYSVGEKKIKFTSSIGLGVNYLVTSLLKKTIYYEDGSKESETNLMDDDLVKYNNLNLSPLLGIGMEYQITNNSKIKILPIFSYGLLKIIDAPISSNLWSTGIQLGYYFGN